MVSDVSMGCNRSVSSLRTHMGPKTANTDLCIIGPDRSNLSPKRLVSMSIVGDSIRKVSESVCMCLTQHYLLIIGPFDLSEIT